MSDSDKRSSERIRETTTRRKCLSRVAGAGATVALVGSGHATATGTPGCRREFNYDSVVNVVEAGADAGGTEPIDDVLEAHAADDTLLYFPEGEYRIGQFHFSDLTTFGMCGKDATLLPEDGEDGTWLWGYDLENCQIEGFTIDNSAPNTGPRVQFFADDGLVVRDVYKHGLQDTSQPAFRFQIETEAGEGLIENVRAPHGGSGGGNGILVTGPFSASYHAGHLTFKDCHVEGFMDNGLYASAPMDPATIHVIGGVYRNNNIANVRLGQADSFAKNTLVEISGAPDYWPDGTVVNMRGIRIADGFDVTIKNCDIAMTADVEESRFSHDGTVHTDGAIVSAPDGGGFSVKNTRIRMDMDGFPAVQAKAPDWGVPGDGPTGVELTNVSITGDADAANHTDVLYEDAPTIDLVDRDHSTIENVCIEQTGTDRDGVRCIDTDATVDNAVIDVTGEPIVAENSDVTTHNVRFSGNCRIPRPRR